MARLKELYRKSIVPELMEKFNYKNSMEVPRIEKVNLNMGVNSAKKDTKSLEVAKKSLALITGQRPVVTRAKRSIAGFSLRKGMTIGCMVTLRGERMYEFLDRLLNLAIPRIRDFQGVSSNGFDGRGNFTLGLREQFIFPEVKYEDVDRVQGLSVTIVTTAKKDEEAKELLASLGVPFASS
ncbi:50S ribosomal protein L5 [Candidatus Aerophobetes bacterium]|uniref:Large ribosomal subunit protein uL5 n=1 Tax=Aerophobetes bacterium TaxID=2030807 RepID=A0A523TKF9_UNCAE|nr:MAG: 50S ribosomal protein L5 [Candidatus Aerophobetes bacterium]